MSNESTQSEQEQPHEQPLAVGKKWCDDISESPNQAD
jgi:hypothetical protein